MKTLRLIIAAIAIPAFLLSCGGHSSASKGGDTAKGGFTPGSNDSAQAGIDTSNVTHETGGAGVIDNSGAGGTKMPNDSGRLKKSANKKQ